MKIHRQYQAGQGLVEALLVCAALTALLSALQATGILRYLTIVALHESTLDVFVGGPSMVLLSKTRTESGSTNVNENELLGEHSGASYRATASGSLPKNVFAAQRFRWRGAEVVSRHSYLVRGVGRAFSDLSAHSNIAGSTSFWQGAYKPSQRLAAQVNLRTATIDRVWRRANPSLNWLDRWSDVSPNAGR